MAEAVAVADGKAPWAEGTGAQGVAATAALVCATGVDTVALTAGVTAGLAEELAETVA